jgi:sporulation protein YlmC with PRC-barrel domain
VSNETQYTIGSEVVCGDGVCGDLTRVVIDPVARALTHLVVEPKHLQGQARLVPIDLVDETPAVPAGATGAGANAPAGRICLRCSSAEFEALDDAEETHFLPELGEQTETGYPAGQAYAWPYYGLGGGMGGMGMGGMGMADVPIVSIEDRVPAGEVEVRRGEHVHASDGSIGRVQGLVVDPADHHVTHVLLQEGHLWGKHDVAIPIGAVTDVSADGVRLSLSKDEVRALPPVDLAHPG